MDKTFFVYKTLVFVLFILQKRPSLTYIKKLTNPSFREVWLKIGKINRPHLHSVPDAVCNTVCTTIRMLLFLSDVIHNLMFNIFKKM